MKKHQTKYACAFKKKKSWFKINKLKVVLGFFQTLKQNEDWKKNIFINVAAAYVFSTETVL